VDLPVCRLAEPLLQQPADQRGAGAAADQHHPVDPRGGQPRVVQGHLHAVHGPVDQRADQILVLVPLDLGRKVQGDAVLLGDELLLDPGERVVGECPLGRLDGPQQPGPGNPVVAEVHPVHLGELVGDVVE
jgi:hypothetical protein